VYLIDPLLSSDLPECGEDSVQQFVADLADAGAITRSQEQKLKMTPGRLQDRLNFLAEALFPYSSCQDRQNLLKDRLEVYQRLHALWRRYILRSVTLPTHALLADITCQKQGPESEWEKCWERRLGLLGQIKRVPGNHYFITKQEGAMEASELLSMVIAETG
jgi:hypothetical protein